MQLTKMLLSTVKHNPDGINTEIAWKLGNKCDLFFLGEDANHVV